LKFSATLNTDQLHIVSFDVPFPDNYGGVIDVFQKIRQLHALGVAINLHCFQYGRKESAELKKYCREVYYYERRLSKIKLLQPSPFIVNTRENDVLLQRLLSDDVPVLLEGLHCCNYLPQLSKHKKTVVRCHNIEHDYYRQLADAEKNAFKRLYFRTEASKLEKFEAAVFPGSNLAAISVNDQQYFSTRYGNSTLVPAFHRFDKCQSLNGTGNYFLYHGNLSVAENFKAAAWLAMEVAPKLNGELIIAGKHPGTDLRKILQHEPNIRLVANPSASEMQQLIREAQVHLLPSFQSTGIKLKLLEALFSGRHVLANKMMVQEEKLKSLCHLEETADSFAAKANELLFVPFTSTALAEREEVLHRDFSNRKSAEKLLHLFQTS
jgi:glycosyltransferase involved in cell wall biosynthesis